MPKSAETEDGSESNRLKICISNNKVHMKRSVRPLFSLLLLIFFAATFTSRTFSRSMTSIDLDDPIPIQSQTPKKAPAFDETLLRLASVDSSEEKTKQEVGQLLDGDMDSIGRYRAFNTWRRFNHRDRDHITTKRARTFPNGVSMLLRSPNFYRHWLGFRRALRDWWRNRKYQPEVMSELVRLVKSPIDKHERSDYEGFSDRRYNSCAVVGNSGILLGSEFGDLIDGHEAVIRLNNARTNGYQKRVGSKTSISFVNSNILHLCSRREGCFCHPYGESVPIVMYICQALHFLDYTVCNSSHASPLIVTDPRFDVLCARVVKYYSLKLFSEKPGKGLESWGSEHDGSFFHYSSGFQAVMLALGVCERVSLFGFGKSDSAKHHYHTNQKAELRLHDYEAEYEFYRDLAERPEAVPFIPSSFEIPPVTVYR